MRSTDQTCLLIRHGETAWTLSHRHSGRTDLPLLPEGRAQARALRTEVAGHAFAAVLTSPLRRARETCDLAGLGDGAAVDPDLAEWDYGAGDGRTTEEIRADLPGWNLFDDGAPAGESAADVGRRADRVIERVRAVPGDVACVAHAHLLRVLAVRWVGLDPTAARCLVLGPASISRLGWDHDQPVISHWNQERWRPE